MKVGSRKSIIGFEVGCSAEGCSIPAIRPAQQEVVPRTQRESALLRSLGSRLKHCSIENRFRGNEADDQHGVLRF